MATELTSDFKIEIAHVLFVDVVGYSRLLINEQRERLNELNRTIRQTAQFQSAEAAGKLMRLPSGDGMALAFFDSPEAPVKCALEISEALAAHPQLRVRMGVHSGPVSGLKDVNDRTAVAGAGVNIAQRVMDCGDAGHILLSKRIADDLAQYSRWQPLVHDLGEVEVKHGVKLGIFNLHTGTLGNPRLPEKIREARSAPPAAAAIARTPAVAEPAARKRRGPGLALAALVLLAVLGIGLFVFFQRTAAKQSAPLPTAPSATPAVAVENTGKSVAVLPFENLSVDPENVYFTDGVEDEIRSNLAKLSDLKVISRISVAQYKNAARSLPEIASALKVTHVLEGSVQRASNRVRVAVQLIDARTDAQLWAQHYDRPLDDVFAIQSEIAKAIAAQLQIEISPSEKAAIEQSPTANLAAYDLYNRARVHLSAISYGAPRLRENLTQAVHLLDEAVVRDPAFMLAYCELAGAHDYLYFYGLDHTPARLKLAEVALENALRLRPDAGEAHLAKAQHLYRGYLDYDGARAELAIAGRTLRNDPRIFELTGYIERRQGRHEEGLQNLQRALELDPRNIFMLQQLARSYENLHRYSEMAAVLDRALAVLPNDVNTRIARAQVNLDWQADPKPLHNAIDAILAENPAAAENLADAWLTLALSERDFAAARRALAALGDHTFGSDALLFRRKFGEGLAARARGDAADAQAAFLGARAEQEELVRSQGDYAPALSVLGMIDAALGRKDEALREGRRAVELLPVSKDALNGVHVMEALAIIYAWTGEKDLACQELASVTPLPRSASYGQLRLHPFWDALRGDARFEKIVSGLAPKSSGTKSP
jgi:TolB-like protein/class 3 adenylate cyclase/Tfp pilus assembly protein PilF